MHRTNPWVVGKQVVSMFVSKSKFYEHVQCSEQVLPEIQWARMAPFQYEFLRSSRPKCIGSLNWNVLRIRCDFVCPPISCLLQVISQETDRLAHKRSRSGVTTVRHGAAISPIPKFLGTL